MGDSGKIPLKITKNEKGCLARTRHLFLYKAADIVEKRAFLRYDEQKRYFVFRVKEENERWS